MWTTIYFPVAKGTGSLVKLAIALEMVSFHTSVYFMLILEAKKSWIYLLVEYNLYLSLLCSILHFPKCTKFNKSKLTVLQWIQATQRPISELLRGYGTNARIMTLGLCKHIIQNVFLLLANDVQLKIKSFDIFWGLSIKLKKIQSTFRNWRSKTKDTCKSTQRNTLLHFEIALIYEPLDYILFLCTKIIGTLLETVCTSCGTEVFKRDP